MITYPTIFLRIAQHSAPAATTYSHPFNNAFSCLRHNLSEVRINQTAIEEGLDSTDLGTQPVVLGAEFPTVFAIEVYLAAEGQG